MNRYLAVTVIIAGLLTGACGDSGSSSQGNGTGGDEPIGELVWFQDDFEAASAEAAASGKPLLIDMYADWCGPCRTLGEEYFTSDEMKPVLSSFVLLRIDVDNPDMASHAQRYNVSAIPCVVIARDDGTEIDRIVGTTSTIGEYRTALEGILEQI
jgi:thiol:disulfide interchange protein